MESKLMLLCGLMLIFCVTAISPELVAYPHVGCFTGSNILRYFNVKLKLNVRQKGQDDVMRCFEAARAENYDIFAVRKPRKKKIQCLTGSDAKKNLDKFQQGSGCRNGLGRQKSFDIYLVPGAETESCQDLPDGEYQDSLFCNRFYTCMDGRAPVKLCPAGLLFDPATRQCLDKVACPHGKPCIDYDDGKYPHPTSCRKYLVCNKHQAFEAECPSYLWFNDDTKECDSPGNTTCSNDPCKDSPCLNGGNCMVSQEEDLQFKCTCTAGFKGTYCEVKPCSLHPCKNGGTCQELGDGTYACKCKLGYGGQNCTVKVKPCSLHPCKNGGTCQELGDSTYVCKCKLGYWGQNCAETDFDSEILSHHSHYNGGLLKTLLEYLKDVETNGKHWKRCFNARDHSFSGASFHALCDNKGPTVTLVEVGLEVFGGYTDQAWTSSGGYKNSTRSFLFSLRNRLEVFKSPVFQHYDKAIHDFSTSGPTFGGGFDLHISSYCHKSKTCFGNIGYSYMQPDGHVTYLSFTGSRYFSCDDYEVFYLA